MQAVVLVDAAPGFESAVEAALRKQVGVMRLTRHKEGNYDFVLLVEMPDANQLQKFLTTELSRMTGVKAVERIKDPSPELLQKLEP